MADNMDQAIPEELMIAIRTVKSGQGNPVVVRRMASEKILKISESEQAVEEWNRNNPEVSAGYVAVLPPRDELIRFVTEELATPEGNLFVKGRGLITWSRLAGNLNTLASGRSGEEVQGSAPFHQQVVLITGAGRGIGAGLAERFFGDGANVVIADVDEKNGTVVADRLNNRTAGNEAVFISADVTSPDSVEELVKKTVFTFGGIDVVISNAGVLKAGSLEDISPEDFDFVNAVNYRGFFLLVKAVSWVMKLQHRFDRNRFTDIIQVNSKSGLQGSNRNFAYAGSKFGSIGLVQSFAKELVEKGIKVNAVCPGNFFDLPLWSDPGDGLFVQYLRTGKVPGAKTVEDVRKYYENRVPMKRGCAIEDLYRAVKYLIEQQYETGQALPVTGGQVMVK